MSEESFDWAQAALQLFECQSIDINELVAAANLDPISGDLRGADFSNLDLSNFDLSGWDLRDVNFSGANLSNTNLSDAKIDLFSLFDAKNWEKAVYTKEEHAIVQAIFEMKKPIDQLDKLETRIEKRLREAGIELLGDLVQMRPKELLRIPGFGHYSLKQVRYSLAMHGLDTGVLLKGWPAMRMREIFSKNYYPETFISSFMADDPRTAIDR